MANVNAIFSVADSIAARLRNSYPLEGRFACAFQALGTGELTKEPTFGTALTILPYRITLNEHLRNARRQQDPVRSTVSLALDLHLLVTVWADSAAAEHTILAWAMREIHRYPTLDRSVLSEDAGWAPDEVLQLIPEEVSHEDLMRIWDAIAPSYRLSVSYVARLVRIDVEEEQHLPVMATRFELAGVAS